MKRFVFQQEPPSFQMARAGSRRCWTKSQGSASGLRQRWLQQITTPGQPADKTTEKLTRSSTFFIPSSKFHATAVFATSDLEFYRILDRSVEDRFQGIGNALKEIGNSLLHRNIIAFV